MYYPPPKQAIAYSARTICERLAEIYEAYLHRAGCHLWPDRIFTNDHRDSGQSQRSGL